MEARELGKKAAVGARTFLSALDRLREVSKAKEIEGDIKFIERAADYRADFALTAGWATTAPAAPSCPARAASPKRPCTAAERAALGTTTFDVHLNGRARLVQCPAAGGNGRLPQHRRQADGRKRFPTDTLTYAVDRLRHYFRNHAEVYASGNLLIYYEEGNPGARVAPDVFVVFGARNVERSSYRLWEESKAPDFVLEITSRATWREDRTWKRELYRRLGVREYWQYDPTRDYLEPPLQGLESVGEDYERLPGQVLADGTLALRSEVLGLELRLAGRRLRFHDPQTGEDLPDLAETEERLLEAEDQRREAAARVETGSGRPSSRRNPHPTGSGRPPSGGVCPPSRGKPHPTGSGRPPSGRSAFGRTRGITTPRDRHRE